MSIHTVTGRVGSKDITIETGKLANLADGAVTVSCGETVILVTAVSQTKVREGQDWFPLSVEYKEKAASAGRFPGGWFKREGRPTEKEILTCRMTDRPLRPLFPKGYLYDTQVIALLLSADCEHDADILCMIGSSAALAISDIPWDGPIGAVRVGRVDGQFVANPTHDERELSDIDLVYSGTKDEVIMIEGGAKELPEETFIEALHYAQEQVKALVEAQEELVRLAGKEKRVVPLNVVNQELLDIGFEVIGDRIEEAIYKPSKVERGKAVGALKEDLTKAILERNPEAGDFEIGQAFDFIQKKAFRVSILEHGKRCDGRGGDDIRELVGEIGLLPRAHGSALFARGETQAVSIATLAPTDERQILDSYAGGVESKRFILHYNFPPFSVGETGRIGGLNRREIGHGDLAERSILPAIPDKEDFPYAIRVTSEVMSSNGSTSMASVCSGSMALLQAGVPLKRQVAGISVGLVTERDDDGNIQKYQTIMDIIGSEDFFGDMDFKLCGTSEGVTGFQLDLKLPGIPLSILEEGIRKAKTGRTQVLDFMNGIIAEPSGISEHAPRIEVVKINPEKIGELIGPGGKNIKAIQAESGAEISIEDDGTVNIYAVHADSLKRAVEMVSAISKEIEVGVIYTGKVVSTTNFGAFVQVLPGKDGMIHISELASKRVREVEDVVKVGDEIKAKCIGVDDRGRVKMSRRAALEELGEEDPIIGPDYDAGPPPGDRGGRGRDDRGGRGGGRRDDRGGRGGGRRDDRGGRGGDRDGGNRNREGGGDRNRESDNRPAPTGEGGGSADEFRPGEGSQGD